MNSYHLLKLLVQAWAIIIVKKCLIVLIIYNRCNKTTSKRANKKTAEATGDLIGNKIVDKITSISKCPKEFHLKEFHSKTDENEIEIPKERYISPEKRQQIIDELRLV